MHILLWDLLYLYLIYQLTLPISHNREPSTKATSSCPPCEKLSWIVSDLSQFSGQRPRERQSVCTGMWDGAEWAFSHGALSQWFTLAAQPSTALSLLHSAVFRTTDRDSHSKTQEDSKTLQWAAISGASVTSYERNSKTEHLPWLSYSHQATRCGTRQK